MRIPRCPAAVRGDEPGRDHCPRSQGGKGPGEDDPRARRPVRPRPATRLPRGRSWEFGSDRASRRRFSSSLLARAAGADERLGEVVVTAPPISRDRAARRRHRPSRRSSTRARRRRSVETLSDALADTVGVQVRRFGGLGDFSTVSVRGFSPRQVQVYLDGVPLARADNETVDLSDLPLDAVEHVEVYRGATPLRFAQSGPGGVVNVVTRQPGSDARHGGERVVRLVRDAQGRPRRAARATAPGTTCAFGHYLGSQGRLHLHRGQRHAGESRRRPRGHAHQQRLQPGQPDGAGGLAPVRRRRRSRSPPTPSGAIAGRPGRGVAAGPGRAPADRPPPDAPRRAS